MATIVLRNSANWNCHLWLKPRPRRKKLWHKLGKNHASSERRQRKLAKRRDVRGVHIQLASKPGAGETIRADRHVVPDRILSMLRLTEGCQTHRPRTAKYRRGR